MSKKRIRPVWKRMPTRVLRNITVQSESEMKALSVMEVRLGCRPLNLREKFLDNAGFNQPKDFAQHKVLTVDVEITELEFEVFRKAWQLTLADPENAAIEAEGRSNFEKNYAAYTERDYSKAQFDAMNAAFETYRSVPEHFNNLLTALANEIEQNPDKAGELEHRFLALREVENEGKLIPENAAPFSVLKFKKGEEGMYWGNETDPD
jgi:hypothetical protein